MTTFTTQDKAEFILQRLAATGARYLGVTLMPGPQLQQGLRDIKRIKAAMKG